jgi:hypothetical protein
MNEALERLARESCLDAPENDNLRLRFGHACALRVKHLLEDPAVLACLAALGDFLGGATDRAALDAAAQRANALANAHQGSKSIDGCGHAAVSASYAVANALAGKAMQAADYAAYATVYGQGGYAAVADRDSFEPEFLWQRDCLAALARKHKGTAPAA